VENHGHEPAVNVHVKDVLPIGLKYISGSTQIDRTGTGKCYEYIDDISGTTPLADGLKVTEYLDICQGPDSCESILVRFKAEPVDPPKHAAFLNTALIYDEKSGGIESAYKSNQGLPLRTNVDFECDETVKELYTEDQEETSDNDGDDEKDNGTGEEPEEIEDESACSCTILF